MEEASSEPLELLRAYFMIIAWFSCCILLCAHIIWKILIHVGTKMLVFLGGNKCLHMKWFYIKRKTTRAISALHLHYFVPNLYSDVFAHLSFGSLYKACCHSSFAWSGLSQPNLYASLWSVGQVMKRAWHRIFNPCVIQLQFVNNLVNQVGVGRVCLLDLSHCK